MAAHPELDPFAVPASAFKFALLLDRDLACRDVLLDADLETCALELLCCAVLFVAEKEAGVVLVVGLNLIADVAEEEEPPAEEDLVLGACRLLDDAA